MVLTLDNNAVVGRYGDVVTGVGVRGIGNGGSANFNDISNELLTIERFQNVRENSNSWLGKHISECPVIGKINFKWHGGTLQLHVVYAPSYRGKP